MRTIFLSLLSVIGGEAAVRAANLVAVLFIARAYGAPTLGAYAVSLALVTVVVMFADNGLQTVAITQMSTTSSNRNQIVGRLTVVKTILLAVAAIILAVVAGWMRPGHLVLAIGICVAVRTILQSYSQLQMAVIKSVSKANWIGIIQFVHGSFLLVGISLSVEHRWSIFVLLGWLISGQLLELLLGTAVLYRSRIWPTWPGRLGVVPIMKMAAPFGIAYGLANLIVRSDTIVLSRFVPLAELGRFSAANSILLVVYVSALLFGSILLPEMARLAEKPTRLMLYANQWVRWVALVTVPCALLVALIAPRGIVALYGASFAGSGIMGSVMAMACPLILLNSIYTTFFVAANRQAIILGTYGACALATLGLDFFLARAFGSMGVASAVAIREAGMLASFRLLNWRFLPSRTGLELRTSSGDN